MSHCLTGLLAGIAVCATVAVPAHAQYRTALSTGWGDDDTQLYRVGVMRDFGQTELGAGAWQLGGYWLAEVGHWDSDRHHARNDALWELALTPVLRVAPRTGALHPYLETGIGGHLLSDTRIGRRSLSTAWQFGSHVGVGFDCGRLAIGYRFQHLSNADIKKPNDGIEFHIVNASLRF
jgi:hypothetical protein